MIQVHITHITDTHMCVYIRVSYICVDAFYSGGFIKLRISRYAFTCHIALLVIGYSNQLCDMKMEFIVFVVLQLFVGRHFKSDMWTISRAIIMWGGMEFG